MAKSSFRASILMSTWFCCGSAYGVDLTIKVSPQSACYFGDWDLMVSELAADRRANIRSSLIMTVEQGNKATTYTLLDSSKDESVLKRDIPISVISDSTPMRISICKDSSPQLTCQGKRSDSFEKMASRYVFTEEEMLLSKAAFEELQSARTKLPPPEDRIYFFNVLGSSLKKHTPSDLKMESALGNIKAEQEGSVITIKLPYLDKTKCG